jgi:2-succinyl-6-hydroxy-2,4-cyclohexadiene-1-carboxylate synthase
MMWIVTASSGAVLPRVVLVPGFTQTAASWSAVATELEAACEVVTLEVPVCSSFEATAGALADAGGRGTWIGYSMGGRLALRLALDRPEVVDALVLVSATAGLESRNERRDRVAADEQLARRIETDGVESFLESWLAQPMFRSVPPGAPGLTERKSATPAALAHQLRVLGTGAMEPVWDRLPELAMPVLIVTGTRDEKFDAIGARMQRHVADATHVRLPGGHALPLEHPTELAAAIASFVRATRGA